MYATNDKETPSDSPHACNNSTFPEKVFNLPKFSDGAGKVFRRLVLWGLGLKSKMGYQYCVVPQWDKNNKMDKNFKFVMAIKKDFTLYSHFIHTLFAHWSVSLNQVHLLFELTPRDGTHVDITYGVHNTLQKRNYPYPWVNKAM